MNLPSPRGLLLPIALYLVLSVAYLFAIPVGESPDEPSHLQCIEQVSRENRLPEIRPRPEGQWWWSRGNIISGYLCYHMPLYYVVSGYLQQIVHALSNAPIHFEFPPNNPQWGASPAMFMHAIDVASSPSSEPVTVTAIRIEGILLGLVSVWAAARVAVRIFPNDPLVMPMAAILIAGWPQLVYMSRAINNDVLATALSVAILVILLDIGQPKRFIWTSVLGCLAILSKLTMFFTAVAVIATFGMEIITSRNRLRSYFWPGLLGLLSFTGLGALIALQPTLREHFALAQSSFSSIRPEAHTVSYWFDVLHLTLSSGWARFGWMNVAAPDWQAYAWWAFIFLTTAIGLRATLRQPGTPSKRWTMAILGLWALGILVSYARINLNRFQPQFRFAFALLPILAAFSAAGIAHLTKSSRRWRQYLPFALAIALAMANFWIITNVVGPAYH